MTPEDIEISVETQYIDNQSRPDDKHFVYAYTITIKNRCAVPAQLISRRWVITDANNARHEVRGLGVVGEQPRLQPGEAFTYTSGVVIETETGTMEGSYQMRTDEDRLFDTPIPTFLLAPPHAVH